MSQGAVNKESLAPITKEERLATGGPSFQYMCHIIREENGGGTGTVPEKAQVVVSGMRDSVKEGGVLPADVGGI